MGGGTYWITENNVKGDLKYKQDTLKKMYDICYAKSDKTKNVDFWEEIIISSTGEKLKIVKKF